MYIYIIIILLIVLLGCAIRPNSNKKRKKIYLTIVFIILAIVASLRAYTVGVDTEQYCIAFDKISEMTIEQAKEDTRYETGFVVLCKILSYVYDNYQILIIVTSIFIMYAVVRFIYEESNDCILSSLLFVLLNCYAMYMCVMRQAIAISIILIGYIAFLKKGKYVKFAIIVFFASLFHQSALIMLIAIPLYNMKFKNKYYFMAIIISAVIYVMANTAFSICTKLFPTYIYYLGGQFFTSNYFASLLNACVSIIFFTVGVYYGKFNKRDKDIDSFYAFMIMLAVIFYVATIKISIFSRITTYFNIFNIIWIPKFISNINKKEDRTIILFILIICLFMYWFIISMYRPEWYGVIPYKTFFTKI